MAANRLGLRARALTAHLLTAVLGLAAACGPSSDPPATVQGDCPSGRFECGGECVDIEVDRDHCGGCAQACTGTDLCEGGVCTDNTCASTASVAQVGVLPADIILVVDNSGSMTDEAAFVQNSMNAFVSTIEGSGIDAHVILVSDSSDDDQGICVPPPMGSGGCPADENMPRFRHVVTPVGSSNSLQLILDTHSQWQPSLRPAATKTIAVISDDNSSVDAPSFSQQLVALDPSFEGFRFNAIVAPRELTGLACFGCSPPNCAACDTCCGVNSGISVACVPLPAEEGSVYKQLVADTGGVLGDLCTQDFQPAFDDMATAVIADSRADCVYTIPEPPEGSIDYGRVNVEWVAAAGQDAHLIPNVPGGAADCGSDGGWYYDDPTAPTQVILCPASCTEVQDSTEAEVSVTFGCTTQVD